MSLNLVTVVGRIGRIESKHTTSGHNVTSFSVAVSDQWTDRHSGQKQERTEWINCTAWGKTAELIDRNFEKGSQIGITGKIQTRTFEKDGAKQYRTEVLCDRLLFFPDRKPEETNYNFNQEPSMDYDEEIPF